MSLGPIVAALGGELYCGGTRASVPAPGHRPADRSVSLLLLSDGRVIVHGFGGADWRQVRAALINAGLIDRSGRISGGAFPIRGPAAERPDVARRVAVAHLIWEGTGTIGAASLSHRHLVGRAIRQDPADIEALRHHPAAPLAVYREHGRTAPALVAAIRDADGALTAIELTYLAPSGRRDDRLRLPRKTVGVLPPGSAVRLTPAQTEILVGEGVMTVLSAMERLDLPGWALMSVRNLAAWTPPPIVRRVLIAADRGRPGQEAAARLEGRLTTMGLSASVASPPDGSEDWNALAMAERRKEGRGRAPERSG